MASAHPAPPLPPPSDRPPEQPEQPEQPAGPERESTSFASPPARSPRIAPVPKKRKVSPGKEPESTVNNLVSPSASDHPITPSSRLTINEIAALAGVSTKTVSRYLNDSPLLGTSMRARVGQVIKETGFVPNAQARALALRRNFLITLVHDGSDRGMVDAVEAGMLEAMAGSEFALMVQTLEQASTLRNAELQAFLTRHSPTGVVLLPPLSEQDVIVEACRNANTNCLRLGPVRDGDGLASDDRLAMAFLVSWLIKLGHRRIGLVGGPEGSILAQQRELGYLDAMAEHDLDRGPALIEPGDNSFASGITAGRVLLEVSPRPSAIIACNDAMAAGLIHAAGEARLTVPDDVSIVGFDDTMIASMIWPPLTSMHIPWRIIAGEAVRCLRAGSDKMSFSEPTLKLFPSHLVERGSVRAIEMRSASSPHAIS